MDVGIAKRVSKLVSVAVFCGKAVAESVICANDHQVCAGEYGAIVSSCCRNLRLARDICGISGACLSVSQCEVVDALDPVSDLACESVAISGRGQRNIKVVKANLVTDCWRVRDAGI